MITLYVSCNLHVKPIFPRALRELEPKNWGDKNIETSTNTSLYLLFRFGEPIAVGVEPYL